MLWLLLVSAENNACKQEPGNDFYDIGILSQSQFTALFNNMRTPKFKGQPTSVFFAAVNQMFGGSSLLPTITERAVIKSNR